MDEAEHAQTALAQPHCEIPGVAVAQLAHQEIRGIPDPPVQIPGPGEITAEKRTMIPRNHFQREGFARQGGVGPGKLPVGTLQMGVGKRGNRHAAPEIRGHPVTPWNPGKGKTQTLLRQVQCRDPGTKGCNHSSGEKDCQRPRPSQQHRPLQEGWKAADVIDMSVSDQHRVDFQDESASLAQGMDAGFTGVHEKMAILQMQQETGEVPLRGGDSGTGAEEADSGHGARGSLPGKQKREGNFTPAGRVKKKGISLLTGGAGFPNVNDLSRNLMKTFSAKAPEVKRRWWVIDAKNRNLGHVAVQAANLLRGKHKAIFTSHVDTGDFVVVINASEVQIGGKKETQKTYMSFSGFVGGHKSETFRQRRQRRPELLIERAVKGMIPHNRLGSTIYRKLKVYAGAEHPHAAQNPEVIS